MDKSWMRTSRTIKQYIDGVEAFIKYAVHNLQKMRNIDPREFLDDTDFDMDFGLEIPTDGQTTVEMVNATKESFDEEDLAKFQELLLDAEKPLYKGCPDFTKLSAIVKLLNLKGKYRASDKFFTELLGLLKKMLHVGNEMVKKTYQAKKLMRMMGSGYKKIHVRSNSCILYWKDNKELTVCPTCRISRWKVDNKTHKVYENIPAKEMWITDGVLRHPTDSQAWRTIDEKFPEIAKDPRNLQLGISADGVDVNSGTRHHSVWPVLSVIKNTGRFTHDQLKHGDFEEIQGLYNKEKELVDTFVPIRSEEDERRIKDLNTKAEEESIPNEEEAIDYEVLDKMYQIVDWKSEFYHNDRYGEPHDYYRVFRADGSSRYIKTFTEMISRFDMMDFLELHSLVMQRFETKTPEGIDLIMWGSYFNARRWYRVSHASRKKVSTYKETLEKMLVLRLIAESESEAAFDLLRFIQKQIDEM
ncbi:putative reverse transcriptase domain-containing protein [Tanacetum coccineum]